MSRIQFNSSAMPNTRHHQDQQHACLGGLLGALRSCHLLTTTSPKFVSNGTGRTTTVTTHNSDHPTTIMATAEPPINRSKNDSSRVNGSTQSDSHFFAKKSGQKKVHRTSSSSNRVEFGAFPGTVLDDCQDLLYEWIEKSGKINLADRVNIQRIQMSAKAFADQMFIDSLIRSKQGLLINDNTCRFQTFEFMSDSIALECKKNLDGGIHSIRPENASRTQRPSKAIAPKTDVRNINRVENVTCPCSPVTSQGDSKPRSFSFRRIIKRKLKHSFGGEKREVNAGLNETIINRKLDIIGYSEKKGSDVMLEGKRHLSARLQYVRDAVSVGNEKSFTTLRRILTSPEHDLWSVRCSPRKDQARDCSFSAQMRFCLYSSSDCSPQTPRKGCLDPMKPSFAPCDETDSLSDNEVFTLPADDLPSTPPTFDIIKPHEEHQSPVSVLEHIFNDCPDAPQTGQRSLQPFHLDFEECSSKSTTHIDPIETISAYVQSVILASCLNWDRLSEGRCLSDEVFDQVEFQHSNCHFNPKLLFDRITEVLLELHNSSHYILPRSVSSLKPQTLMSLPLEEVVLNKMMSEAELYLLPEITTLDQIVAKDVASCDLWADVGYETEQIAVEISKGLVKECIWDMVLDQFRA